MARVKVAVSTIQVQVRAGQGIPDVDQPIITAASNPFTVRRSGKSKNILRGSRKGIDILPAQYIPYEHLSVVGNGEIAAAG
jgi:hypothetical protein